MALPLAGCKTTSGGVFSAIGKQLRFANLKAVKKIEYKFDPFRESSSIRDFMFQFSTVKVKRTNVNCIFRTEVLSNREEPTINISLVNGNSVLFKCGNLTTLELLKLFNKHITVLAPKEDPEEDELATKYTKKLAKKR